MDTNVQALIGMGVLAIACAVAFVVYNWWQQIRVHRIEAWVREVLFGRYGELPKHLYIHCSYDRLWPVLVHFQMPQTGTRHTMQFNCGRARLTWVLVSERDEQSQSARTIT